MPGTLRVVCDFFDRVPDRPDTRGITLPESLMPGPEVLSPKMPPPLHFGRCVRRGENLVQARDLYLCNRLEEPAGTFAFRESAALCCAIAGELGK